MNLRILFLASMVSFCHLILAQSVYDAALENSLPKDEWFPFGVASGDPTQHAVVLWTALHPALAADGAEVLMELSASSFFDPILTSEQKKATPENAYSVVFQPQNLQENTRYFYRFVCGSDTSVIGETKTLPENPKELAFAVVSCSNYEWGYFNAYASIARTQGLDFVIHLGDYIYEYEPGKYGDKDLPRKHLPASEILTLSDYRTRYAQYRLDPHLQELHRTMPMIAVWDDHEIANNAYRDGAENHQASDGEWELRVQAARKAYFEWMPIIPQPTHSIQRAFHLGELASLWMMDGRLEGRSKQLASLNDPMAMDSSRSMLGVAQRDRLLNDVKYSKARWKILGNQVVFSSFDLPQALAKYGKSMDMWEGYPVERNFLMNSWRAANVTNLLVLTGDAHASFCMDLRSNRFDAATGMGAEWVTPSVTSGSLNEYIASWKARIAERKLADKRLNPHLRYVNFRDHGFMIVRLTETNATCSWYFEKNIRKPRPKAIRGFSYSVPATL